MISKNTKTFLAVAVIVTGFIFVFFCSNYLEKNRQTLPESYTDQDLSLQGEKLKGWSLGFEGLIADWYWMRSLQYIGDKVSKSDVDVINIDDLTALNPRLLYPLLDNATTLDPKFIGAYSYGAIVLPAIDPEKAIKITEKGIKNNPNEWRLYQHLGYIYWKLEKYEKASETYQMGSTIKGAPPFFKMMAARMKDEAGSRETARRIYQQMYDEAEDLSVKENAKLRLMQLDSLDERDVVRRLLKQSEEKTGRCPSRLSEIFSQLQKEKLPGKKEFRVDQNRNLVDPSGAPYLFNKEKCDIDLDLTKTKIPSI